ncbi:hypothetical protein IE53DRAFT_244547 [Violaceomyces palustris]|uniref:Uncharacterized protein n=1 Tax=Violaceomyces palustris TaxID=1673888 RepID=A0ACD0P413_9BASI|nr:hypothetical protein IE53DRAFT_244547 [Violaceomyces palustris]
MSRVESKPANMKKGDGGRKEAQGSNAEIKGSPLGSAKVGFLPKTSRRWTVDSSDGPSNKAKRLWNDRIRFRMIDSYVLIRAHRLDHTTQRGVLHWIKPIVAYFLSFASILSLIRGQLPLAPNPRLPPEKKRGEKKEGARWRRKRKKEGGSRMSNDRRECRCEPFSSPSHLTPVYRISSYNFYCCFGCLFPVFFPSSSPSRSLIKSSTLTRSRHQGDTRDQAEVVVIWFSAKERMFGRSLSLFFFLGSGGKAFIEEALFKDHGCRLEFGSARSEGEKDGVRVPAEC